MHLRFEQIPQRKYALLRNVERYVAGRMRGALIGNLKRQTAKPKSKLTVENDAWLNILRVAIGSVYGIGGVFAFVELHRLFFGHAFCLDARGDDHGRILAKMPSARRMIAGGMGNNDIADRLIRGAPNRSENLVGRSNVGIEDDNAFLGNNEDRIARSQRMLHDIHILGDLAQLHLNALRAGRWNWAGHAKQRRATQKHQRPVD